MIETYYFKKGRVISGSLDGVKKNLLWVDVTNINQDDKKILKEKFELHPVTCEDLYKQNVRIKVEEFDNYIFCVFYGVEGAKTINLSEIDFVIGKNFILTNHRGSIDSIEILKKDREKLKKIFEKGVDFIFHKILSDEIRNYFDLLEKIDDQIEIIDHKVIENPNPEILKKIMDVKHKITVIKRHALSQREKISFIANNEYCEISKKSVPYFRDVHDHMIRVTDGIANAREAIGNSFETYMSSVSNKMNETMKFLSVIATTALPLTVLSGIYGTNFRFLPGASSAYGFWAMMGIMVCISAIMMIIFKRKGWL